MIVGAVTYADEHMISEDCGIREDKISKEIRDEQKLEVERKAE